MDKRSVVSALLEYRIEMVKQKYALLETIINRRLPPDEPIDTALTDLGLNIQQLVKLATKLKGE